MKNPCLTLTRKESDGLQRLALAPPTKSTRGTVPAWRAVMATPESPLIRVEIHDKTGSRKAVGTCCSTY